MCDFLCSNRSLFVYRRVFIGCCNDSKNKKVGRMNLLVHCLCNFARGNATREISVRVYLLLSEAALSLEK